MNNIYQVNARPRNMRWDCLDPPLGDGGYKPLRSLSAFRGEGVLLSLCLIVCLLAEHGCHMYTSTSAPLQRPRQREPFEFADACTDVCDKNNPFARALTMQSSSINFYPAPELVLRKLVFPRAFFSEGTCFSQTPVSSRFSAPRTGAGTRTRLPGQTIPRRAPCAAEKTLLFVACICQQLRCGKIWVPSPHSFDIDVFVHLDSPPPSPQCRCALCKSGSEDLPF